LCLAKVLKLDEVSVCKRLILVKPEEATKSIASFEFPPFFSGTGFITALDAAKKN
jgi:hypothetical protein